jgi:hypothetical protein
LVPKSAFQKAQLGPLWTWTGGLMMEAGPQAGGWVKILEETMSLN